MKRNLSYSLAVITVLALPTNLVLADDDGSGIFSCNSAGSQARIHVAGKVSGDLDSNYRNPTSLEVTFTMPYPIIDPSHISGDAIYQRPFRRRPKTPLDPIQLLGFYGVNEDRELVTGDFIFIDNEHPAEKSRIQIGSHVYTMNCQLTTPIHTPVGNGNSSCPHDHCNH